MVEIDLSQFHEVFFEESVEGLDTMESNLLGLDIGNPDSEKINTVFRAAHSIKGGAGTFGFDGISNFTHVVESLLDEIRDHKRSITKALVDILLEAVDCIRHMIEQSKEHKNYDENRISDLKERLTSMPKEKPVDAGWKIDFLPREHMLRTGNDPFRLIRELQSLGNLIVHVQMERLPPFSELDPESCYLGWNILLTGGASREHIADIFEWVEGDCELRIYLEGERRHRPERRADHIDMEAEAQLSGQEAASIRVGIDKVDSLINLVGELVITQSMLSRSVKDIEMNEYNGLMEGVELLERNTRELQEQAMRIRMLPIDFVFQRLLRLVHDLCRSLGKQAEIKLSGNSTEVDKTVLEKIGDPMVHLIRNAVDHGIETPEQRRAAGKPETGLIEVSAYHESGNIIIKIKDDGKGLDRKKILAKAMERNLVKEGEELSEAQIQNLIFQPGFSTAEQISNVSGRGVGMDVVKRNINTLGGDIEVTSSEGMGSTFIIRLPLTLAILDGQLVQVGNEVFIIPLTTIVESVQINVEHFKKVSGESEVYRFREEYVPVIRLNDIFNLTSNGSAGMGKGLLVITETGQRAGLFVDDVIGQQQVVIKSLESNFRHVKGLTGATILGDGTVAMILDIPSLVEYCKLPGSDLASKITANAH